MPRRGLCRVCFEEDSEVIAPCQCKGTAKWVHRKCLNTWRASGSNPKALSHCCECNFEYRLVERENASKTREPPAISVALAVGVTALVTAFLIVSTIAVVFGSALYFANMDAPAVTALWRAGRGAEVAAKTGEPVSSQRNAVVQLPWMWSVYAAGVSAVGTLLGIIFAIGFARTFPGRCYEETSHFVQCLRHGPGPSAVDWWNLLGSICVIYWIARGVAYACTAPKPQVLADLDSFLAFIGLSFGALTLVLITIWLTFYSYREWLKVSAARQLTNTFDVADLADPEDMGDIEDQKAPSPPSSARSQPELQRKLGDSVARIYGREDAAAVGGPRAPEGDISRLDVYRVRLETAVSRSASGLLGAAPPQPETPAANYGSSGSASA